MAHFALNEPDTAPRREVLSALSMHPMYPTSTEHDPQNTTAATHYDCDYDWSRLYVGTPDTELSHETLSAVPEEWSPPPIVPEASEDTAGTPNNSSPTSFAPRNTDNNQQSIDQQSASQDPLAGSQKVSGAQNSGAQDLSGTNGYSCRECGRNCESKRALIKHLRTHFGEKPFKCY